MIRQTKYFLAFSCLIALGVIIYRYARLENTINFPGKTKIYSFNLGKNAVTIKQGGLLNQVENVDWSEKSPSGGNIDNDIIGDDMKFPTIKDKTALTKGSVLKTDTINEITTKTPTAKKITAVKLTTHKVTEKSVVTTLPPLTKAASTKQVVLVTTQKSTIPVISFKSGDVPQCSAEGEKLGKCSFNYFSVNA